MKIAKSRREAGFRENGVVTGFSGVFAKTFNAAKSGALEQESYVSGSSEGNFVEVQVLLPAPNSTNPNPKPVGEGFGFVVYFGDLNLTSSKKNKK